MALILVVLCCVSLLSLYLFDCSIGASAQLSTSGSRLHRKTSQVHIICKSSESKLISESRHICMHRRCTMPTKYQPHPHLASPALPPFLRLLWHGWYRVVNTSHSALLPLICRRTCPRFWWLGSYDNSIRLHNVTSINTNSKWLSCMLAISFLDPRTVKVKFCNAVCYSSAS